MNDFDSKGLPVVTGATGTIGRALVTELGHATVLTRNPERAARAAAGVRAVPWNPTRERAPEAAIRGARAVFHLAGEPIAGERWTKEKKQRIATSRILGTRHLVQTLGALDQRPSVLVSASAVGYYGDRGDEVLTEVAPPSSGFMPDLCAAWEREALRAEEFGVRVVIARIGIVLSRTGGALAEAIPLFRWGLGGRLGSGRQWMPWVHVRDAARLLVHAASDPSIRGPMNVASPAPVRNAEFTRSLAHHVSRPVSLPVPRLALRAALGEVADVVLSSAAMVPAVALDSGFRFEFEQLDDALADLIGPPRGARAHEPGAAVSA